MTWRSQCRPRVQAKAPADDAFVPTGHQIATPSGAFTVGGSGWTDGFTGVVDEVAVYSTALTDAGRMVVRQARQDTWRAENCLNRCSWGLVQRWYWFTARSWVRAPGSRSQQT